MAFSFQSLRSNLRPIYGRIPLLASGSKDPCPVPSEFCSAPFLFCFWNPLGIDLPRNLRYLEMLVDGVLE